MVHHFEYRTGELFAEDVPIAEIAKHVGTPFYCYSTATITRHYRVFEEALSKLDAGIYYSVKANSNLAVIRTLAELGAGADIVSGGELQRALTAGIASQRIVFSGVGKTDPEIVAALDTGILQFNIESRPELEAINRLAIAQRQVAPIAVRVNPDVDAATHAKITTGTAQNKFGISRAEIGDVCSKIENAPELKLVGLAMHIGSQLLDLAPFNAAFATLHGLVVGLRQQGHTIERLDIGGGLGIPYAGEEPPSPSDYATIVERNLADLGCHIMFEPGRLIVGNAGLLVTQVVYVKEAPTRRFIIVDAAMNDLLRPALYDAVHQILPVSEPLSGAQMALADVVGPVCESGDTFATQRALPPLRTKDLLAFASAGAYGAVMASSYNSRPLVPEVLVNVADYAIVRRRPTYEEMLAGESIPEWFAAQTRERGARN